MNKFNAELCGLRLKKIREELGIVTQSDFAKKLGIKQTTVSKYENGATQIPDEIKVVLSENGINIHWLLTGEGEMLLAQPSTESFPSTSSIKIPLLRQRVSCGKGIEWTEDNIEEYIEPLEAIPGFHRKNIYAFRAAGLSMIGVGISDGDILFFDGDKNQTVRDDIYVFGLAGEAFCKLLRFEALENTVRIYSVYSQDIRSADLIKSIDANTPDFQIFGRVIAWMHENRLMNLQ